MSVTEAAAALAVEQAATGACPICGEGHLDRDVGAPRVTVRRCGRCGHRVATHALTEISQDYHGQYDQGAFLDALAIARRRQAQTILALVRRLIPDADCLLDYGAGRGWFLDACRSAGMSRVAAADTSSEAVARLEARGIPACVVPASVHGSLGLDRLPFRPRVLSLLDVVEHFRPDDLTELFGRLLREVGPQLQLVVVKVPVANGFLYRVARALASGLACGPIEQLYQVGTFPPHFSYFTRDSMRHLLAGHRMHVVAEAGVSELDTETAGDRVVSLGRLPPRLARAAGALLSLLARYMSKDSVIFVAAPRP
ncbi:MAG TPA: methyltransferase domain-containing protein [Candidatus Limnocylindria bacterium]|jgi:hypothetical protein|nr:methyltransferase domain-containing protein [Candidatus Limnocylindria bacterium]